MTPEDLALLRRSVDRVVALELISGEQLFAEIVILVDEPPTPDVFILRVQREPDGAFSSLTTAGESILLGDIRRVAKLPSTDFDKTGS